MIAKKEQLKIDKKLKWINKKWFKKLALLTLLWVFVLTIIAWGLNSFFDKYRLQTPVIFQPIIVEREVPENAQKTPIPEEIAQITTLSNEDYIKSKKHATVLEKIWMLESGQGKDKSGLAGRCLKEGKSNEFGYGSICFDTFQDGVDTLDIWFDKRFDEGMDLAESICFYNLGRREINCTYWQKYQTL